MLHFAHRKSGDCTCETVLHSAAKHLLHKVINAWIEGNNDAPAIHSRCKGVELVYESKEGSGWAGYGWSCSAKIVLPLMRNRVDECLLEFPLSTKLRPDLLLRLRGKPVLAIEILVTHEVGLKKREMLNVPWVELRAEDVIRNPIKWLPIQHNIRKFEKCDFCLQIDPSQLVKEVNQDLNLWIESWRKQWKTTPYISYQINRNIRTIRALCWREIRRWCAETNRVTPGQIHLVGDPMPIDEES